MTKKSTNLKWGIIGTGSISRTLVKALPHPDAGELVAIASRDQARAEAWAEKHDLPEIKRYGSHAELLADPEIDAVYICLLNDLHCPATVMAAEAGKHILCEKPAAMNRAELMVMLEACRQNNVFFMEAFMWRCHPGTAKLVEVIKSGTIGEVRSIDATFGFNMGGNTTGTRMDNARGGGAIMDVGCYAVSAARLIAGAALGQEFADPLDVQGFGHVGSTDVDEYAVGILRFPNDIIARLGTGIQLDQQNQVTVWGSEGRITVPSPWFADGKFTVHRRGAKEPETHDHSVDADLYLHELSMVARCVADGRTEAYPPGPTWADSISQQIAVDRWRKSVGVVYPQDKPENQDQPLTGRPLAFQRTGQIPQGRIAGLDKPIARVIMGCNALNYRELPLTCALLDDYFERGGNAVDTAHIYGENNERGLGAWVKLRGIRDDVVLIGKGAHLPGGVPDPFTVPGCDPVTLTAELHQTLDRLATDHLDIYIMHRDNPQIPAGEFVDVLNQHVAAGRIRIFGGSNWTIERFAAANAYAVKHGKQGFSILNNNFSLATWNEPMWAYCVASSDPRSCAWIKESGVPFFAWSSQASGFFTGLIQPNDTSTRWASEVTRVWGNPDNYRRLERAQELAAKKGCTAIQIALAYVLCQPFNVWALIGPRTIEETRTSLLALEIKLTPDELVWLNLEK